MATTQGKLYFVATKSLERLEIQFVPNELGMTRNSDTQSVQVVGRNNPFYHYTAGETLLNLELDFHAEREDRQDVIEKCRWLEGLAYNDDYPNPPEVVKLVFGQLFKDEIWVVKSVNYKLTQFDRLYGFFPKQAKVTVSLALDVKGNYKKSDLR